MLSSRPSPTGREGEKTKNGNLAVTVLRLPVIERKRRQFQVPAYRR